MPAQAWQRIAWWLDHTVSDDDDEAGLGWDIYAAAARASVAMRERDEEDVPQWLRDAAAGKAISKAAVQL